MNFDSFSHGQIHSKIWLCEELEKFLPKKAKVTILGGWYNVLGFMMLCRRPEGYESINNIDIDPSTLEISNKITNAWLFDPKIVTNDTANANDISLDDDEMIYINCSPEHFESTEWFDNLPIGSLVCIQSISITDPDDPWFIRQPNATFDAFAQKYPITSTLYEGTKRIQYDNWGYDRFMIIGYR
jgi:hypothetical protein